MPLLLTAKTLHNSVYAVWTRTEGIRFFLEQTYLNPEEINQIYGQVPSKLIEWISSRYLLKMISGNEQKNLILKDIFGKPYFSNSNKHVSLSHCGKMISALVSDRMAGIDIEKISTRSVKVKNKFVSDKELAMKSSEDEEVFFTKLWTIKEAVYKAYGRKQISFKEQINIEANNYGFIILNDNSIMEYDLESHIINDHILSIAVARS